MTGHVRGEVADGSVAPLGKTGEEILHHFRHLVMAQRNVEFLFAHDLAGDT